MSTDLQTSIGVSKHTVKELLSSANEAPFVIPEYQRPYAWEEEHIQTLLDDLWSFALTDEASSDSKENYFLGSVVSYSNENGEQEIIDGQQRITSLFLLLRAMYTKISAEQVPPNSEEEKTKTRALRRIEPALWKVDDDNGDVDFQSTHITSCVINDTQNEVLQGILSTGEANARAKDRYSLNYRYIQKALDKLSMVHAVSFHTFARVVAEKVILLSIHAKSQETALTIFSTLNDRGMQLSDADIFKAKIYHSLDGQDKPAFIRQWQEMDEKCKDYGQSMWDLFNYYMYFLKAKRGDSDSSMLAVRKFYADNQFAALKEKDLMDRLDLCLQFIAFVTGGKPAEEEPWTFDNGIRQRLDILRKYPNEYWKYPVIIFFLCHHTEPRFAENFDAFLKKFIQLMLTNYLETHTLSTIKHSVLKLNVSICETSCPNFNDFAQPSDAWDQNLNTPHPKAVRMLLLLLAYDNPAQTEPLPDQWEIEHILPQKWQPAYFDHALTDGEIAAYVEHLGNKVPFEKKLNIVASNGYMSAKKDAYRKSEIAITRALSEYPANDWRVPDIKQRDEECVKRVREILEQWRDVHLPTEEPTDEISDRIREAKQLLQQEGYDITRKPAL